MRGAVLLEVGSPLEIRDDIEIDMPHTGEVLVNLKASGVCHSDLSMQNGTIQPFLPCVLGHEGAGIVEAIGPGVTTVAVGDHVVISWVPQCGACYFCLRGQPQLCDLGLAALSTGGLVDGTSRLKLDGHSVYQLAASGTFAEQVVVPEIGVVPITHDLNFDVAALLGCAVLTGVGAALNTADIAPGDSVGIIGCGGVGLNVIQGAAIAGAAEIIALDINPAKLELAEQFDATSTISATGTEAIEAVKSLTGGRGVDVAFDVLGLQSTIDQAIGMTRRGGQSILVGIGPGDASVNLPSYFGFIFPELTVKGCLYGSSNVKRDVPRLLELHRTGRLRLEELVSQTIALEDVNSALDLLHKGEGIRSVIRY